MSVCREEPVCLKCSEGLVTVNVGARPSVLNESPSVRIVGRSPSI